MSLCAMRARIRHRASSLLLSGAFALVLSLSLRETSCAFLVSRCLIRDEQSRLSQLSHRGARGRQVFTQRWVAEEPVERVVAAGSIRDRDLVPFSPRGLLLVTAFQAFFFLFAAGARSLLKLPGPFPFGSQFYLSWSAFALGLWSTPPLFVLFLGGPAFLRKVLPPSSALADALEKLDDAMCKMVLLQFGSRRRLVAAIIGSAAVGLTASVWEEFFFRVVLQSGLVAGHWLAPLSPRLALGIVAVLFGACHAMSPIYFAGASLAGAYFGYLFMVSGNVAVPMIAHAIYDFGALVYIHLQVTSMTSAQQRVILKA